MNLAAGRKPAAKRAAVAAAEGGSLRRFRRAPFRALYRTAKKYPPRGFLPRGGLSQSGECAERRTASLRGRPSVFCAGLQDPCSARHSFCTAHNSFPAPQVRGRRRKTLLPAAIFRFCNVPYGSCRSCAAACRYAAPQQPDPYCSPEPVRGAAPASVDALQAAREESSACRSHAALPPSGSDMDRAHRSAGSRYTLRWGNARLSAIADSSGTKTCTITSVQVLFTKLLNFNFETRFRSIRCFYTLAANAIQVNREVLLSAPPNRYTVRLLRGEDVSFPPISLFIFLSAHRFDSRVNIFCCPSVRIFVSGI